MLRSLTIQNYAIIDELETVFSGKLNVITGETGAGKSIIVGALNLILGERADSSVLVNKEKKCIVEGVFSADTDADAEASASASAFSDFFRNNELDALSENEIVIRREIAVNGKSRAFINDTPVNLSQLQQLSSLLVDLHQQFDTQELGESDFQRQVIDALAANANTLLQYRQTYQEWQALQKKADILKQQKLLFDKEADYNQFQYSELADASFRENELEDTDAELKMLANAEGIKAALNKVYAALEETEEPMLQQLKILLNQLHAFTNQHPELPAVAERLQSVQIELQDIADEIDRISNHINYDAEKIEQLNERLSIGYRLQKKHGVNSTAALLQIQAVLENKLNAVLHIDEDILQLEKQAQALHDTALKLGKKLSDARLKQVKPLEEKVNTLLGRVGMPNAKLKVSITPINLNSTGADNIEFLFDANKSGQFQPLRKVASGGELSRLMLCIKSLVAQSIDLPTMIFDEIDTGISGEAARQVGIILKELALQRQVICITHQPQIAGKADIHFFVYKEIVKNTVKTNIRQLSVDERITAIAKMLSGEKPTAAAIENAREMVAN